eukprot:GHRR01015443.1.p1 GENE.GHRR01015443.1~~GHRR01015443.1.p1  ORF type:complete len:930 (+),score=427.73 GHRR01015443.1:117-2906(+)
MVWLWVSHMQVRFVVMANIFVTDLQIHRRYDIKGSTDGRTVGPEAMTKAADGDSTVIFKDLDVDTRIVLQQPAYDKLIAQLTADADLLRTVGVMDYSLLLGVHYPTRNITRMSLEAVPSASLDGTLPHTILGLGGGQTPGGVKTPAGANAVPGSGLNSGMGSFTELQYASGRHPRSTMSDDDVQQPPQQFQQLVVQQQRQQLLVQLQQHQRQQEQQQQRQQAGFVPHLSKEQPALAAERSDGTVSHTAQQAHNQSDQEQQQQLQPGKPQLPQPHQTEAQLSKRNSLVVESFLPTLVRPLCSDGGLAGVSGPPPGASAFSAAGAPSAASVPAASGGGSGADAGPPPLMACSSSNAAAARNWELFSGAAEQNEQLGKVVERMQGMGYSEQRMKDIVELARLKILGGKLKKSTSRKEPPSVVLQAMQQQRQEAEADCAPAMLPAGSNAAVADWPPIQGGGPVAGVQGFSGPNSPAASAGGTAPAMLPYYKPYHAPSLSHLTSLRGAFTGLGVPFEEDEMVDTPTVALGVPDPKAPTAAAPADAGRTPFGLPGQQLGINMVGLAVPTVPLTEQGKHGRAVSAAGIEQQKPPEEVVVCFGIIDILQDYSTRKVLERTVKGLTHDKCSISVAPPKLYAKRLLDFTTSKVFMSEAEFRQQVQQQQRSGESLSIGRAGGEMADGLQQQQQQSSQQRLGLKSDSVQQRQQRNVQAQAAAEQQQPGHWADAEQHSQQYYTPNLPLAAEDSEPLPPGQIGVELSALALETPTAAAVAEHSDQAGLGWQSKSAAAGAAGRGSYMQNGVVASPFAGLLAAPTGLELTSPVVASSAAAATAADSSGQLVPAEKVAIAINGVTDHHMSQGLAQHEPRLESFVSAVVLELPGKDSTLKAAGGNWQGLLLQQQHSLLTVQAAEQNGPVSQLGQQVGVLPAAILSSS